MKFQRSAFEKNYAGREITPQRLAAANRHAQKQRDKVALFPDLAAQVEEPKVRLRAFSIGEMQSAKEWRDNRAQQWRDARRRLERMPEQSRRGLLRYWEELNAPKDPVFLSCLIIKAERNPGFSFWSVLRELRQIRLFAMGKLPASFWAGLNEARRKEPWRFRDYNDRNLERFRRRRARKLGQAKIEFQLQLQATA